MKKNQKLKIKNKSLERFGGFTLIELLVVFSVIVVITSVGLASFASYGNGQALQAAGSNVVSLLQTARSRALAQIKPSACATSTLQGYNVRFVVPGSAYALNATCNNADYAITTQSLSSKLTFMTGSATKIAFNVLDGTATPGKITITSSTGGVSKVVTVDGVGNIKIATAVVPTPTPTPSPTPTPTLTLTPTPTSTPTITPTFTPTPTTPSVLTLSGLTVYDTSNSNSWSLKTNLQVGNALFGDRTYAIVNIPSSLLGSAWVQSANASKTYTSDPLVKFSMNKQATVYVAHDVRTSLPGWLNDGTWKNTGMQITDDESNGGVAFEIYSKVFSAGTVSLGHNAPQTSGIDMYIVIVQ